ncbi:penicillin-binding protein 1A [Natronincola peptidivorans]|uniref:Penicillin-binding protein 1A n=1 Tax=Natronincola peptidivorans TaxID=426128 RepID=A0A1H9Z2W2_9FIRM|nr:PBP1A family penicillin-binding protein [Natronincola peptidivorans]SES75851.1 penicillin-binding protein 1A [Natronincola peptidivorans]
MSRNRQPENTNNKSNKKTKKKNIKKIILLLTVIIVLIGFIAAGAAIGIVAGIIKDTEPIDASNIYDLLDQSSFILDSEGQVLEKVQSTGYRDIVSYNQIPSHLVDAFIAIEDERFWNHSGLDLRRIFGVIWTNLRTGSRQGASTISQQLAKNIYLTHDQTYTRKIQDMYYGIQLEKQLSKQQILEAYLNTIYLGSGADGVQAAAQIYFSKDVSELTVAESALIAGIARNPLRFSPMISIYKENVDEEKHYILDDRDSIVTIIYQDSFQPRQRLVLNNMKRLGMINEATYEAALDEDIKSSLKPNRMVAEEFTSYFGDLIQSDVLKSLVNKGYSREEASTMLHSGGLRIYSTMDPNLQRILDEEYAKQDNFKNPRTGEVLLEVGEDGNVQPQSAMVVLDHTSGEIKALVGGRGSTDRRIYNRAINPRQAGSAIKPIAVYTPAIDMGFTAGTVIDDVPVYFDRGDPTRRYPTNFERNRYRGLITIRESVRHSSNVGAVVTIEQLGNYNDNAAFNIMFDYMQKMGISTVVTPDNPHIDSRGRTHDATYSTALGGMTYGVSPLDLTAAYGTLANEGVYTQPITFTKVTDRHGNLIIENTTERNRVVSPEVAYIMTDMLRTVVTSGTGTNANLSNRQIPVAGKTGTTNDAKDFWFVGYTPYYTAATWIGYDTNEKTLPGTSGSTAAPIWQSVMDRIHSELSAKNFQRPDNIIATNICRKSGKLPTEYCLEAPEGNTVISEIFIRGTQPTEYCDLHVMADIHVPTGKLATEYTPPWEIESRIFVDRPIPYYPEEHGGIVPDDYAYDLPKEYYDPLEDGGSLPPFLDDSIDGSIDNGYPNDFWPYPPDNNLDEDYYEDYYEEYDEDLIIDSILSY